MATLLFLVHRLPYPPNKGDKVRSHHLLKFLAQRHRVFVGTFVDDEVDASHIGAVEAMCAGLCAVRLHSRRAKTVGLFTGLVDGGPLTFAYYRSAELRRWIDRLSMREQIDAVVVFSSTMAQYVLARELPMLVDFVDVDSAKWSDFAAAHRWPMSWIYRREARKLLDAERRIAAAATRSFFVTDAEAALFRRLSGSAAPTVETLGNGVDADYFCADVTRASPFDADRIPIVFSGAMDYFPNVDAVTWFVRDVLPALLKSWPKLQFHIVGRAPSAAVQALAGPAVHVTGSVADVRPYLQHAAVVVAPLRVVRGVQNKILEAMAMGRPVVASAACMSTIDVTPGQDIVAARSAAEFVGEIGALLGDDARAMRIGTAASRRVRDVYRWADRLEPLNRHIDRLVGARPVTTPLVLKPAAANSGMGDLR